MDVAKNLEKVKLEHEVEELKTKITKFEKSKQRRQSHKTRTTDILREGDVESSSNSSCDSFKSEDN